LSINFGADQTTLPSAGDAPTPSANATKIAIVATLSPNPPFATAPT
jgi:hypothetical protein